MKNNTAKKYNVIYVDPPWSYRNKNTGGSMKSGASAHYDTMSTDDICKLPIPADKNCVLFMWATVPMLPDAFQVLKAWGFKYKTMLTWRKINSLGMGYWYRGQCEHLILAVKGNIKAFRMQEPNFIQCKVEKHSKKPELFAQLIERSIIKIDNPVMLELFAREPRAGWDVFGNEVDNSIEILPANKAA